MDHKKIEKKWQEYWSINKSYYIDINSQKPKYLVMDMFPYPSGSGLHVGHTEGYTGSDIITRFKTMQGYNVLHPMGWDAFGLPAEQYALDTGNNPATFTNENIEIFEKQLKKVGFVYDWSKEVNTTDPGYFKWTQWIFIQLFKQGLAEVKNIEVNWCESLGTVLANEEVLNVNGKMVSERGSYPVIKKPMKQWVLKITHYADRLLEDLEDLDWPESIKEMQRNWIGKSNGANVKFYNKQLDDYLIAYTTRPDTLFGATYFVMAPEHQLVQKLVTDEYRSTVNEYIASSIAKSDFDRTEMNKDKTGVFIGSYVVNPVNGKEIPIWISDYVLASYGTGMIMAVPAHDERDYEFATKFNLPIISVIDGEGEIVLDGKMINSDFLNGLDCNSAKLSIIKWLEEKNFGEEKINYKLRDWIFARQRYWGEPFPIIHYEDNTMELVEDLPLKLPILDEIKPSGTGEGPLAMAHDWVNVVRADGVKGKRDTNTMPQWAGSCWYYIGYILQNKGSDMIALDSVEAKNLLDKWLPVDMYIGGAEHAVLHLLYSRFWHKVLYDVGVVSTKEPFYKLVNQGMILGENNEKMSKSKGNVVNPDDIINEFGADTLRMYEMFMGPFEAGKPWNSAAVNGVHKFLDRVYRFFTEVCKYSEDDNLEYSYNLLVKNITFDFENLKFNTAVSSLMVFINDAYKSISITKEHAFGFLQCLYPIAPHIAEELNALLKLSDQSLAHSKFPSFDESVLVKDEVEIVVQVNGKVRAKFMINNNAKKDEIIMIAKSLDNVVKHIEGLTVIKEIYVPLKLVNLVVK